MFIIFIIVYAGDAFDFLQFFFFFNKEQTTEENIRLVSDNVDGDRLSPTSLFQSPTFPCLSVGTEPMTLGSPTSPKPTSGAQFLPGFLMGDLPAPSSPQQRPFSITTPIVESTGMHQGQQEGPHLQIS